MEISVLLVDDEQPFAVHMSERLSNRGLKVEVVYNGEEALSHLKEHPVDVIVLDERMPGMDGIETLKNVKNIRKETQVIILTGYGTVERAAEAKENGAAEYIIKPFDTVQLAGLIKDVYEKRK
ncbi:MAG: response regulator [Proteobacteria bacterium]|nr:response regulator [Pseudomonadota bacterium]